MQKELKQKIQEQITSFYNYERSYEFQDIYVPFLHNKNIEVAHLHLIPYHVIKMNDQRRISATVTFLHHSEFAHECVCYLDFDNEPIFHITNSKKINELFASLQNYIQTRDSILNEFLTDLPCFGNHTKNIPYQKDS